jgi:hypothetical protein
MSVSAAMRRTVRTETPLRAAMSFDMCPARRSMSIILSLAGDGISDDLLAR